jgi:hypothetical protein
MRDEAEAKNVDKLREVREALLRLHKVLLDYQREVWERGNGRIKSSYELLNLVMHEQKFAWLHYLSEFVVQVDERLALEEANGEEDVAGLLEQARFLIVPAEMGDSFQRNYFRALQDSPDVVLAHSETVKVLGKRVPDVH